MTIIITVWLAGLFFIGTPLAAGNRLNQTGSLENLGEPIPYYGVPSTQMWRAGHLLYGEATIPAEDKGPFFVYDLAAGEVIYTGNEDIHTGFRNIMVDRQGNAYFSVNTTGLAKYDPNSNRVSVLPVTLPGVLRASTRESAAGWIYGITNNPATLFRFNPAASRLESIGEAWGYTAHIVLDPTEQYLYYIPNAHGNSWELGTPVLQFNVATNRHKVIAFLNDFYETTYGYRLGGTYALDIDPQGKRLFINMNTQRLDSDPTEGFGSPAILVVHIPEEEAGQPGTPGLQFEDVAPQLGLEDILDSAYVHTASWGDVDNDGRLDLFAGTFVQGESLIPNKLLLNKGGGFVDAGQTAVEVRGRAAGSVLADLDNDGDLDLYISNNRQPSGDAAAREPSHLLRNDHGTFVDVTTGSGVSAQTGHGRQVGVLDYNHDNRLDMLVVADALTGSGPTVLLKNLGDFKFEEATTEANLPPDLNGLGLAIGDVTNNGWPDIFIAGGGAHTQNYLWLANGDGTYRQDQLNSELFDWSPYVQGPEDWVSSAAFGDLNRDGRLDLVVGHHFGSAVERGAGAAVRVYLNRGLTGQEPLFEDITLPAGLEQIASKAPHVEIQDFNNDGWPDIYTSIGVDSPTGLMPLIYTHNGLTGSTPTFSTPAYTNPHYYAGGPVADFNGDGKLDLFLSEWRSVLGEGHVPSRLMQNSGPAGHWLQVRVDLPDNRMGVGARVKIYRPGMVDDPTGLLGMREISPAFGFSSSQPAIAHFGLGQETAVDLVVELPFGGPVYLRAKVPANRRLVFSGDAVETVGSGDQATAVTDESASFLTPPVGSLPVHSVASTPPGVDFVVYPHPDHAGNPWAAWGGGLLASNGRFYGAIGDHQNEDGNAFVYEYDPLTKALTLIGDVLSSVDHVPGTWGHGKIHSRISEGADGYLYMSSYWGSRKNLAFEGNYKGSVLLRYPLSRPIKKLK